MQPAAHQFACRVECKEQRIQGEEKEGRCLRSFANKTYREIFQQEERKDVKNKNSLRTNFRKELHRSVSSNKGGAGSENVIAPRMWVSCSATVLSKKLIK